MISTPNNHTGITGSDARKLNTPLKFITFNCRGLPKKNKRLALFTKFHKANYDFIALQETHVANLNNLESIAKEWGGPVHYVRGTGWGKGLMTLFHPKYQEKETKKVFNTDRILVSNLQFGLESIHIINVYGPSENQYKCEFFQNLGPLLEENLEEGFEQNSIVLGDMNIAKDEIDILSGAPHSNTIRQSFINFIDKLNLIDAYRIVNPAEKTYTWRKTCRRPKKGWCNSARRIDYVLISENFNSHIKKCSVDNPGFSDHRAVILELEFSSFNFGPGLFKLNTSLLLDKNYCKLINDEILSTVNEYNGLNPQLVWEMVKVNVREVSQQYSRYKARERKMLNNNYESELKKLETLLAKSPGDIELNMKVDEVKTKLETENLFKSKGAQIRSRTKYVEEGERNTKFFLNLEKFRSNSNTITRLTCGNEHTCDENKILAEIKNKFSVRYNNRLLSYDTVSDMIDEYVKDLSLPKLNENQQKMNDEVVTEEEISKAIKLMNNNSAPGSDGLPAEFYKVFWSRVKRPLLACYHDSFINHCLPESQRLGVISLLHKGKDLPADNLDNWRPISLLNVDLKIISKVLSMRMDKVIDGIVGSQQVGFMKGRDISCLHRKIDNIIELQKRDNKRGVVIALDFKQAFDAVNINCILKSLEIFGFGQNFIRWISVLNSDRLASVKNGGHISDPFSMSNGVRQGCPISPQLFLLVVEIMAQKIIQDPNIKGLNPGGSGYSVKILQYCDDTSLFLQSLQDIRISINHLNGFATFSDLYLNLNKSYALSITGDNFDIGDTSIQSKDTVKILGIFYSNKAQAHVIRENWQSRVQKTIGILNLWSKRYMSIIGRLQIIKTHCLSQFVFVMKCVGIPEEGLQQINTLFFRFLWGGRIDGKKVTEKIKRNVLFNNEGEGGLKMVDMVSFQGSIYLGWAESLLSATAKDPGDHLMSAAFFRDLGGLSIFRCLLDNPNEIRKLSTLVSSVFWSKVLVTWLRHAENESHPLSLYDPLFNNCHIKAKGKPLFSPLCIKKGIVKLNDVIINGSLIPFNEFYEKCGRHPQAYIDYHALGLALKKVDFLSLENDNQVMFQGLLIGKIGRKAFYYLIKPRGQPICNNSWTIRYGEDLVPFDWLSNHKLKEGKLIALCWKILHRIYPTNLVLFKMGLKDTQFCMHCSDDTLDTIEHFFYACGKIRDFWREVSNSILCYMDLKVNLTEKVVLIGAQQIDNISQAQASQINKVIAVAKLTISKFKFSPVKSIIQIFEEEAHLRNIW